MPNETWGWTLASVTIILIVLLRKKIKAWIDDWNSFQAGDDLIDYTIEKNREFPKARSLPENFGTAKNHPNVK